MRELVPRPQRTQPDDLAGLHLPVRPAARALRPRLLLPGARPGRRAGRGRRAMTGPMRAARVAASTRELSRAEVPVPALQPHEVLVRVQACGVCLSDVHLIDGSLPGPLPVVTPGHEPAGVIEAVGADVPFWQPGQRVVMVAGRPCLTCARCGGGQPDKCLAVEIMGFSFDGAWAEYVVVPYGALPAVPDSVPIEQAAILADAVSTPYAALVDRANLRPGESLGVWGVGGLGVHAVKIGRLMGAAPIVAVDPLPAARERALRGGADVA